MASTDWRARVKDKLTTPARAMELVKPGDRVFVGTACGTPQALVQALVESPLEDVEIVHILTLGAAPYAEAALASRFRTNALFISANVRAAVQEGRADYTPIFLSEIPRLFRSGRMPIDAALISVTPPDKNGFCSFGVSVDITKPAAETARTVIAEVNPNMPRTLGDSFIHESRIHAMVENDAPLFEYIPPGASEEARRIAKNVADLIEDGATIQVGYGGIPSAVIAYLRGLKDLGVHTEVFGDSTIELIESGVINNARKTLHPHKVVAAFAMGTRKLYDYIDNNPMFEFHPVDYTNDPFVIAQNDKMVSINSALEIDLTGQVAADSIGGKFYSGIGGHVDFIRGAARSRDGRAILVLKSTRDGEAASRIVPILSEGAGVVTSRGDVHYVVTEWGAAYLHGKSVRERAMALISIAHPKFRIPLLKAAKERRTIPAGQPEISLASTRYPEEFEARAALVGGATLQMRPIKPTDEPEMRKLFHSFSKEAVFYSFFSYLSTKDRDKASKFVNIDYEVTMALVGSVRVGGDETIVGAACYALDRTTGLAEAAIVVREGFENRGVGAALGQQMIRIAKIKGVKGFVIFVMDTNTRGYRLIADCGYPVKAKWEDGVYSLTMRFDDDAKKS